MTINVSVERRSVRVSRFANTVRVSFLETGTRTIQSGGGSGDVVGPALATNNAIVLFDTTTGKLLKDSATLISSLQTALGFTPDIRTFYKDNVGATFTGTTNESTLASISVPLGTIQANDIIVVVFRGTKSGSAGTLTWRLRIHTSTGGTVGTSFSSGTIISTTGAQAAPTTNYKQSREIVFKNSVSSSTISNTGTAANTDFVQGGAGAPITTLSNDFGANEFIILTAQLASGSDTAGFDHIYVRIIRG